MDLVVTMHVASNWSEDLWCTIPTHLGDFTVKVMDFETLCYFFFKSISLKHADGYRLYSTCC